MQKFKKESIFAGCVAECVATFVFVFIGAGSVVAASYFNSFDGMAIAAAHGFAIFVMVSAIANVSGGHINPVVTFAVIVKDALSGNFKSERTLGYITAQLLGAVAAGGVLHGLMRFLEGGVEAASKVAYGTPGLSAGLDPWGGFLLEMIFSFVLVFVILRTAIEQKLSWAPLAIGMTVFVLALFGGPLTGAAMNPARWFGPAIISGVWDNAWVYVCAPLAGAWLAIGANGLVSARGKAKSQNFIPVREEQEPNTVELG